MEKIMPQVPVCQSCSMPMIKDEDFGTNMDGSKNEEYCQYCFKDGKFTAPDITKEEMVARLIGLSDKMGVSPDKAREMAEKVIPNLKRWK
jgi:hypothetical protein